MCELLGMSANHPTDIDRTLRLFSARGGSTGPHADGWGLAYYEGKAARVFKESHSAARSECLDFIAHHGFSSSIVIGHIRKARPVTVAPTIANTHPFQRELFGHSVVFAHNGFLPGVEKLPLNRFQPVGETDSEWAFCYLLDRLAEEPTIFEDEYRFRLTAILAEAAEELKRLGEFNFLLSEGRNLFAYGHTNLYALSRACQEHNCKLKVALVATNPVTDRELWRKLSSHRITVFRDGVDTNGTAPIGPMDAGSRYGNAAGSSPAHVAMRADAAAQGWPGSF